MFGRITFLDPISGQKHSDPPSADPPLKSRPYFAIRSRRVTIGNTIDDDIRIRDISLFNEDIQIEIFVANNDNIVNSNECFIRSLKGMSNKWTKNHSNS